MVPFGSTLSTLSARILVGLVMLRPLVVHLRHIHGSLTGKARRVQPMGKWMKNDENGEWKPEILGDL